MCGRVRGVLRARRDQRFEQADGVMAADPAGNTLTAGLVAEELYQVGGQIEQVSPLGDDDDGAGAEHATGSSDGIEVQWRVESIGGQEFRTGPTGQERLDGRSAGNPASPLDQLGHRCSHRNLVDSRLVDVSGDRNEFQPREVLGPLPGPPVGTVGDDRDGQGEGLDVVDQCRLPEQPDLAGVGRLVTGFSAAVLECLEQSGLLAQDVTAG